MSLELHRIFFLYRLDFPKLVIYIGILIKIIDHLRKHKLRFFFAYECESEPSYFWRFDFFPGFYCGLNCVPQTRYVEVLTPSTPKCDFFWK